MHFVYIGKACKTYFLFVESTQSCYFYVMICPNCKNKELQPLQIGNITIDNCADCKGSWFDYAELDKIKDFKISDANWFDVDLFSDETKFSTSNSDKLCPKDNHSLFTLKYANSEVEVDVCKECKGIWLDKGEFENLMKYVEDNWTKEVLNNYRNNLIEESKEIFTGPESLRSEVADLMMLLGMFKYKFLVENDTFGKVLINLPRL